MKVQGGAVSTRPRPSGVLLAGQMSELPGALTHGPVRLRGQGPEGPRLVVQHEQRVRDGAHVEAFAHQPGLHQLEGARDLQGVLQGSGCESAVPPAAGPPQRAPRSPARGRSEGRRRRGATCARAGTASARRRPGRGPAAQRPCPPCPHTLGAHESLWPAPLAAPADPRLAQPSSRALLPPGRPSGSPPGTWGRRAPPRAAGGLKGAEPRTWHRHAVDVHLLQEVHERQHALHLPGGHVLTLPPAGGSGCFGTTPLATGAPPLDRHPRPGARKSRLFSRPLFPSAREADYSAPRCPAQDRKVSPRRSWK